MEILNKLRGWLTPGRRRAIYAAVTAVGPMLITLGVTTEDAFSQVLVIVGALLSALAGGLALLNLSPRDAGHWFVREGRAAIYTGAATVVPALVALDLLVPEFGTQLLTILSTILTALAGVLAVVNLSPSEESSSPS